MKLIDFPKYVALEGYQTAIEEMVNVLMDYPGVSTIFQVGGLSSPGISDIDFFVVFDNDMNCSQQPLSQISPDSRYLFTHGLFGTAKKYASQLEQYTFFKNYRKLWGANFDVRKTYEEPTKGLQAQIALEYLAKMYITLQVENFYKTRSVRNFLLLAKAVEYDLKLLSNTAGALHDLCTKVLEWRSRWFDETPSNSEIKELMAAFEKALETFIVEQFNRSFFYLPNGFKGSIARNMKIVQADALSTHREGFAPLPWLGTILGKKYARLMNRLVQFTFKIPHKKTDQPSQIEARFNAIEAAARYNQQRLPHFLPTGYPLNMFGQR